MSAGSPPLKKAIRRATGAASVGEGEHIQQLWDGYGEVLRFELHGASVPSVVVKHVCPPVAKKLGGSVNAAHARKLKSYQVEAHFYGVHASRAAKRCRMPQVYQCQKTQTGFLFILEDLDAAGYAGRRTSLTEAELLGCLRWLAEFHAAFLDVKPEGVWKVGTYWSLNTRAAELARMTDAQLREAAPKLEARLNQCRYKTWVHGDAKPANFCFSSDPDRVAALDFQYTGGGCGVKDVAYLLDCCLGGATPEHSAEAYLDAYFAALRDGLSARQVPLDVAAVEAEWRTLYPVAWADFARFLDGWAPGMYTPSALSRRLIQTALNQPT